MTRRESNLRWGVERRLEFIEFRLFWEGRMNRGDLMKVFGVSVNQASTDLNRYLRLAPENMVYDKRKRAYLCSSVFSPLFLRLDSDRYLSEVRSVRSGVLSREDAWLRSDPQFDEVPNPTRTVNPETLRMVLEAMRHGEAIEIHYQSFSRPSPRWRWIAPHAIGFDGFRWHVRAFCDEAGFFKDFVLGRVLEVGTVRASEAEPADDHDWHEHVDLEIGPNPGLSEGQREVVELDYGMREGKTVLRVRRAFLFYVLKRLGLEQADAAAPNTQHIVLLNREVVEQSAPGAGMQEQE